MINKIEGGVTAAKGFEAASAAAGIKYQGRQDMTLVYSTVPCKTAGAFTTNVVKAAPVIYDKNVVDNSEYTQAVIINAGIANACTGEEGLGYCRDTAKEASRVFGISEESVMVASTGVIGKQLPIDKIIAGVSMLYEAKNSSLENGSNAARSIMTTDTKPKEIAYTFEVGGKTATIGGMCKGAGMIHPNMCTMLCFLTTDVNIDKAMLTKALKDDVPDTFNMISVDGDTSTNDTVLLMANGLAGNLVISSEGADYDEFCKALHEVMLYLSKAIAGDGEGCTCLFEVTVNGANTKENAKKLAKSVITSSLTKAAIFGHDANWGRILCALGYSGVDFDPYKVDIWFESSAGRLMIVKDGIATDYSEEKATEILSQEHVIAVCEMNNGTESATAFGCDLTYEYVKINGDYRS